MAVQNILMQIWLAPRQFASASGRLDGRLGLLSRNLAIHGFLNAVLPRSNRRPHDRDEFADASNRTQVRP